MQTYQSTLPINLVINELTRQFKKIESDIAKSRVNWSTLTKPFLLERLESIKEATKLEVTVKSDQKILPLEAIIFAFDDALCGLCYNEEHPSNVTSGHSGDIKKIGGILYFEQRYNGQIVVWMDYPYIDYLDRPIDRKNEVFTIVSQDKIDGAMVDKYMQDFLSKVNTWHRREYKPIVGY